MEMPKPTAAHQRLNVLAGKWQGQEKMHPSPWDPQGGMADAKIDNQLVLDGFAIVQSYSRMHGGAAFFTGHCVMTYDGIAKEYRMHWWDSLGSPVDVFRGQFDGQRLMLHSQNSMGYSRGTFNLAQAEAGRYSFSMEVSPDGLEWAPFMDGSYVRA